MQITKPYHHPFSLTKPGLVAIFVSARCKSMGQIRSNVDEDLRVEINGLQFREIPPAKNKQIFNIPPAFSGSKLKGLKKIVIFLTVLTEGKHIVSLIPKNSAYIEDIKIQELGSEREATLPLDDQAEDGNCREWYTFVFINLSLKEITIDASIFKRFKDSDDIKVIANGKTQLEIGTKKRTIKWRFWLWAAELADVLRGESYRQVKTLDLNLSRDIHYLEIIADRRPKLHNVGFDFGETPKRTPTVDEPKWTGDFDDDTEQMILARAIWGEARNQSKEARVAVGWSIRNRVEDRRWKNTYHEVVLEPKQYFAFWEQAPNDNNLKALRDPIGITNNPEDHKKWRETYEMAGRVIEEELLDPTGGANHYYDDSISAPDWATEENLKIKIDNLIFYKL